MKSIGRIAIIMFVMLSMMPSVYASDLDSFESSTSSSSGGGTRDSGSGRGRGSSSHYDDDDDDYSFGVNIFSGLINGLFGSGGRDRGRSHYDDDRDHGRSRGRVDIDIGNFDSEHIPGGFCVPYFRSDIAWQYIKSDIEAIDYRVQAGAGMFAIDFNHTRFNEWYPSDGMDIYRAFGLLRLSANNVFELDLGLGTYTIDGESSHTGMAATMPIIIAPTEYLAFEFRPVWTEIHNNQIKDFDLNVSLKYGHVGFRGGYRWLETETQSLNGPYLGMTVRF